MIAKDHRFTRRQFAAARKRMKSFRSGPFLFLYRTNPKVQQKFAVVVKKKTEKRAVVRNRFKRLVYTHLQDTFLHKFNHLQLICLHQGKDMKDLETKAFDEFSDHYQKTLT